MAARKASSKAASRSSAAKAPPQAGGRRPGRSAVPGVSRIDQDSTRTHGYFVRVGYQRGKDGSWRPRHRAFFGDAGHGGRDKAYKAALRWRRLVLAGKVPPR